MHGAATFVAAVAVAAVLAAAQSHYHCLGLNGPGVNCTSSSACCGGGSYGPSCLLPGNKCCGWYTAATQCADTDTCCGEGMGQNSGAFCCGAGLSCCAWGNGSSTCCGPKQQCCKGINTYCCDAETETCGPEYPAQCFPKHPITPNPHPTPGRLEWAANLSSMWIVHAPVIVNSSFVVASGGVGTALVRVSDGAATFILPQSVTSPTVAGGHVIIYFDSLLMSYDLKLGKRSWNSTVEIRLIELVGHGHYLLAIAESAMGMFGFDARNGTLLYSISYPYRYPPRKPVVSPFGTAAFVSADAFIIFRVATGENLVNVSTACYPPPLLAGSIFVSCNLVAYSARNGKELWAPGTPVELLSIAATTNAIVGATEQHLLFVDRFSGEIIKKVPFENPYYETAAFTAVGNDILVAVNYLIAYNGTTGALLWNYTNSTYDFSTSGAAHLGNAYIPASTDTYPFAMVAVDATTGRVGGSWGVGGWLSSPMFIENRLLFMATDGFLYCVTAF